MRFHHHPNPATAARQEHKRYETSCIKGQDAERMVDDGRGREEARQERERGQQDVAKGQECSVTRRYPLMLQWRASTTALCCPLLDETSTPTPDSEEIWQLSMTS